MYVVNFWILKWCVIRLLLKLDRVLYFRNYFRICILGLIMKMNNLVCVIKRKFDMLLLSNCKVEKC